ncbi:o-succinylbenzoate synthase [Moritella yayanosii]|uniref:o-succinylbenzoate synthase n=1 Tax=Moritella yayanosii TaxID=69539 RepID=A0A330LLJ2_9GAMM|nr:o-succinylbenzoate synthase [Moritella yayanosii]SQD77884.1 o-succinylbenzoyl-CoA synthase [Moritella yayanosii]
MPRKVKLYHYQLSLDCAMILRDQSLTVREGWIVELQESAQLQGNTEQPNRSQPYKLGRGEIAPLPGFSQETATQAKHQLESVINSWLAHGVVDLSTCCPSVAFGFSMALLELENGLAQTIHCSNNHHHANSALLLAADYRLIKAKHAQLVTSTLCKLKIATQPSVAAARHDGDIARYLLQTYSHLRLRLDANRRWSLAAALAFANQLPAEYRQRIDFIEEPCHTPSDCLQFSRLTGIAIAWDESLREIDKNGQEQGALPLISSSNSGVNGIVVKAIVIKPMLTGTVAYCAKLIELAHQQGLTAVISSSLESSFGLTQLARLAQLLTPDTTPGLDTVNVFKQQLVEPWPNCTLPLTPLSRLSVTNYQ